MFADTRHPALEYAAIAGVAELVYAADLKSVALWACGFDSRHRHHFGRFSVCPSSLICIFCAEHFFSS